MKPLKLNRTTVRNLNNDELSDVGGGTILTRPTLGCPITGPRTITTTLPTTTRTSAIDACPSALGCTSIFTREPSIFPGG